MEINCGSDRLTTLKHRLLTCACGETALATLLVCALVKAQLVVSVLTQEYMKLLMNQTKLRGEEHISCPMKPVDVDDDDDDDDDNDEEDEADDEEDETPIKGNDKSDAKKGPGGVEENGEGEDEDEPGPGEDDDDDDDDDEDEEDDDDDDDEDEEGEEEGEEGEDDEKEEEEDDEDEEALQPPKKRKK